MNFSLDSTYKYPLYSILSMGDERPSKHEDTKMSKQIQLTHDEEKMLRLIVEHRELYQKCCDTAHGSPEWQRAREFLKKNRERRRVLLQKRPDEYWDRIKVVDQTATAEARKYGTIDEDAAIYRYAKELLGD